MTTCKKLSLPKRTRVQKAPIDRLAILPKLLLHSCFVLMIYNERHNYNDKKGELGTMKKTDLQKCIKSYFDKKYDITNQSSNTPKISVYYMIGYLSVALGRKLATELEDYMDNIQKERFKDE